MVITCTEIQTKVHIAQMLRQASSMVRKLDASYKIWASKPKLFENQFNGGVILVFYHKARLTNVVSFDVVNTRGRCEIWGEDSVTLVDNSERAFSFNCWPCRRFYRFSLLISDVSGWKIDNVTSLHVTQVSYQLYLYITSGLGLVCGQTNKHIYVHTN